MNATKGQAAISVMVVKPSNTCEQLNTWAGTGSLAALVETDLIAQAEVMAAQSIGRKLAVDQQSLANLRPDMMEKLLRSE